MYTDGRMLFGGIWQNQTEKRKTTLTTNELNKNIQRKLVYEEFSILQRK
jgi:hypothetical protein